MGKRYAIVTVHGEGKTVFHIVDKAASTDEQPCIMGSRSTRDSAESACAYYERETKIGEKVAKILLLHPDPEHPMERFVTTIGTKTPFGLALTVRRIIRDIEETGDCGL